MRLAHQMAFESDMVTAEMIEATEFPQLAVRHGVMAVPKIVVNGRPAFDGMRPEGAFVDGVLAAGGRERS